MQFANALLVDRTNGIKTIERLADVNRSQRFADMIELAPDLDQHADNSNPFGLGQGGDSVGHADSPFAAYGGSTGQQLKNDQGQTRLNTGSRANAKARAMATAVKMSSGVS
jgi:hypothetical protein